MFILVVMVISTNIKPFFINYFDMSKINTTTNPINIDETSQVVMTYNQIVISILSKNCLAVTFK